MAHDGTAGALSSAELRPIIEHIHATLAAHRQDVDALNVFPVPDGDTGTNMTATIRAAVEALDETQDATAEEQAHAVARAALRGARGNSGVILSQILRALVHAISGSDGLDDEGLAAALEEARELAYDAVADPVEGTILTTISRAAERARACAGEGQGLGECLARVLDEVEAATEDTGQMLRANRDAGVVDAGARGFALVVTALHEHVNGEPGPRPEGHEARRARTRPVVSQRETGSLAYHFEVQYLLEADETIGDELREALRAIGDSVVVVASDGLVSVHVHTNDVGGSIELGLAHGRPSHISVVYFADQMRGGDDDTGPDDPRMALGCLVVLPSGPLHDLAREQGAVPIAGTSGDLPSVDDLLAGIRRARADRVVLLPGHRNVVPTARQARDIARTEEIAEVDILPSATSVPAVVAALAVFDPEAGEEAVLADLEEAVSAVRAGEVVAAVRDADTPIGRVGRGQHLTIAGDEVIAASEEPLDALRILSEHYAGHPCELVTLIVGADVSDDERERAVATVLEVLDDVDLEVVDGRQRPARYLVGVE